MFERHEGGEKAVLVHVDYSSNTKTGNREDLDEFIELVTSAQI